MATLIIHGTQTHRSAAKSRWWWNAWDERGFVGALARGMEEAGVNHDVWTVAGRPVRDIAELRPKWSLWRGRSGKRSFGQHEGHFLWDGADMGISRDAAATSLAKYLVTVAELSPGEPISIVAHSHGCNVTKQATQERVFVKSGVRLESVVFLACPHWDSPEAQEDYRFVYRLNPQRVGRALNLFNSTDNVQVELAEKFKGIPGPRLVDHAGIGSRGFRVDQDPAAQPLYENYEVPMEATNLQAHTEIHGASVGYLAGLWLGGAGDFGAIINQIGNAVLPVPLGDDGEGSG